MLTAHRRDTVVQAEAEQMGGTFVLMPTTESELLAAVMRATQRSATDTTPITAAVRAKVCRSAVAR